MSFIITHLQRGLISGIANFKSITTIQSDVALRRVIGVLAYLIIFVIGASAEKSIPGLYHSLFVYPLSAFGIMRVLHYLEHWKEKE